ncbi:MAG: glycyl-radical enzyme activating protein family, partial [Atopobiaceae bacterium]|nr:glycyl-radical enzyme activating protein family [Atopobiaceae bacterium]
SCDELLVDLKVADRERSLEVCGIDCDLRDDNLRRVLALGAHVIARMPIIPGFTDTAENVDANIATMLDLGIGRADVLPFHQLGETKYATVGRDYSMGDIAQLTEADVAWVADACEVAGIKAVVHGE